MSWSADFALTLGAFELVVDLAGGAETVAVVGRNGAGKSALLRTLAGAHRPRGRIAIDGAVFDSEAGLELPPERRRVGYVPQGFALFPHLTALENVAFGAGVERARAALARFGAEGLADRSPGGLSGGERQKVALARALAVAPRLLLLDEPLSALDVDACREARATLAEVLAERGIPALIVTHDPRDVRALATRVCVLEGGRVAQFDAVESVTAHPANAYAAALFADT